MKSTVSLNWEKVDQEAMIFMKDANLQWESN